MQKNRITPLPSADITNPSILGKSLSSIPRSLNASLSQLSFSSAGSLSRSISSIRNPNESRPIVKNYIAPTNATKRHGSDIRVIYHADQLADKWENILPLKLDPLENQPDESQNVQTIAAEITGVHELQNSPIPLESTTNETPVNDKHTLEDLIHKSVTDLVDKVLLDANEEVVQLKEAAIRKSAEMLVEDVLRESLLQEPDIVSHDLTLESLNLPETVIKNDTQEAPLTLEPIIKQEIYAPKSDCITKDETYRDSIASHTFTESDSDESDFDLEEMEKNEQEQLAKNIMERTLKMIDLVDRKEDVDLDEDTSYRKMITGSWMVGLNASNNYSELRDSVIFKGKKYSIKLNSQSISCADLFHKKYAFYFPIMLNDVLSATYSAGGLLYIFFLQSRIEKGPKLRCIQLKFISESQPELWASTIIKRKWKEKLKKIAEKQALLLVDKRSQDLLKLVKKYICSIFKCTGKIYTLKEIEISDSITDFGSILGPESKLFDTIALFSNDASNIKDSLQKAVSEFFDHVQNIEIENQDTDVIDAVQCASLLLNSQRVDTDLCFICCSIKRQKGLIQKIFGQFATQDSKSIVNIAK